MEFYEGQDSIKNTYIENSIYKLNDLKELNLDNPEDIIKAVDIMESLGRNMSVLNNEFSKRKQKYMVKK